SSREAKLSESEQPGLSQDEGLFEIKEVLEDYDKTSDDEVELKASELVRVEEVDPSGWIKVRKADGTIGWASESFLGNPSPSRMDQQEPMCPMRLKGRHKAQIAYGVVILISASVWAWLQAVERHPLPDVDLARDDGVHWPVVL
ncbi:hypothetical protein FOZ62_010786, partial [Perkinsus olseni]